MELLGGKTEPSQIYPEYYVIKVNNYDGIAKNSLDQWVYCLKNNEIEDDFITIGMKQDELPIVTTEKYTRLSRNEIERL
jgi:hypothetical protein